MKSYTLKLKTALCVTALFVAGNGYAANNSFMQDMTAKIEAAYDDIEVSVKKFIEKDTPADFRFGKYCDEIITKKDALIAKIIQPIKDELAGPAAQADATYKTILQKTLDLAQEILGKFENFCKIMNGHADLGRKNSPDYSNTTKFLGTLKPVIKNLLEPAVLDKLTSKLSELENLLIADNAPAIAKQIAALKVLIGKVKNDGGNFEKKWSELYLNMKAKLKKL